MYATFIAVSGSNLLSNLEDWKNVVLLVKNCEV